MACIDDLCDDDGIFRGSRARQPDPQLDQDEPVLPMDDLVAGVRSRRLSAGGAQAPDAAPILVPGPMDVRLADPTPARAPQKQLTKGRRKPFIAPDPHWKCCKRRGDCHVIAFANKALVEAAREIVFTEGQNVNNRRAAIKKAVSLLPGQVCTKARKQLFSCGGSFLNPKIGKSKGDANRDRGHKMISIISWFMLLLPCLDKMPDERWYQVPAPDRNAVYGWYLADREKLQDMYPECHPKYFMKVWRENLGKTIRLRRYTRFTKCSECLELRREKNKRGNKKKLDKGLLKRLTAHYALIKRYRGRAMKHAILGATEPHNYLSIAQDGTDQMGYGFPRAAEHDKDQDNFRLKTKVMITMVHGDSVHFYVMPENVFGGPNETIECLQRTFMKVALERGRLPKILFLQFDNCSREGKNGYLIAYVCWLVERGVFTKVYVSFHPKGHTHNECDQCASRISLAVRNATLMCKCEFQKLLEKCYVPRPNVEWLEEVMDFKTFVNPGGDADFREDSSYVHRASSTTESLLWKMEVHAESGKVAVYEKATIDQEQWSTPFFVFRKDWVGRPLDELIGHVYKPVPQARLDIIERTLASFHDAQNQHQRDCCQRLFEHLSTPSDPTAENHWSHTYMHAGARRGTHDPCL